MAINFMTQTSLFAVLKLELESAISKATARQPEITLHAQPPRSDPWKLSSKLKQMSTSRECSGVVKG